MKLFSKEKDIIFRIANGVLLIWLVAATTISVSILINIVLPEPVRKYTYEEYKIQYCSYMKTNDSTLTDEQIEQRCQLDYNNQKFNTYNSNYYNWRNFAAAVANIIIVGGVMFVINREKKENIK